MTTTDLHSVSTAAVVTDDIGLVLVVQRRDTNRWEIPGGVLEPGETIHDGLRREVEEETGVVVNADRLTGVYKNMRLGVVALVFRAHVVAGQPRPTTESTQCAWWTREQVTKNMAEVFAVRVTDALDSHEPAVRNHDGTHLLDDRGDAID